MKLSKLDTPLVLPRKKELPVATIWVTGLSASGKTTLGKILSENLTKLGFTNFIWLDGEVLRDRLDRKYGFTHEERFKVLENIVREVQRSQNEKKLVIISAISHLVKMREYARNNCANFYEIYLKCSVAMCAGRDFKGNYKLALEGQTKHFIGVTEPYEESKNPELIVDTEHKSKEKCADLVLKNVLKFLDL